MKTIDVFEEAELAGMKLRNRIIRSATHEGLGGSAGRPMDELKRIYIKLAEGGVGAIIAGYAGIAKGGRTFANMKMLDHDELVSSHSEVVAAVKPYRVPLIQQLAHGGAFADPAVTGSPPKAPSKMKSPMTGAKAAELTGDEIGAIIAGFVSAARRAKEAGYDGVQIHAAHGYLLSEFLSPRLNKRRDRWGGTTEKRFRIIREIGEQARNAVGDYPILIKMSAYDDGRGGMRLPEAVSIARLIQGAGFDAIEVSCGNGNFFHTVRAPNMPVDAMLKSRPGMENVSGRRKRIASWVIERKFHTYKDIFNYNAAAAQVIKNEVDIPVIVVTTEDDDLDRRKGYEAGANVYVIKPTDPAQLVIHARLLTGAPWQS